MAKTAVDILTAARDGITKKGWVCGELDQCSLAGDGKKVQHMACAIGLVSLAAGATRTVEMEFSTMGEFIMRKVPYATYPYEDSRWDGRSLEKGQKGWTRAAVEAVRYLVLSIPDLGGLGDAINEGKHLAASDKKTKDFGYMDLADLTGAVTSYNDSHLTSYKDARKWFNTALARARRAA